MTKKIKWAFLCSFWGKNAKDVIAMYAKSAQLDKIALVLYEQEPCGAEEEARINNIPTIRLNPVDYKDQNSYQDKIISILKENDITHVFLLGFQYLIKQNMLNTFPDKIANIHPSLFPSFLATKTAIQDAIDYGVKVTGITTHLIDHRFDRGTIICQEPILIVENDTFESLYEKFSQTGPHLVLKTMQIIEKNFLSS